ncbi:hypothetical protein E6R60_25275 [Streptomyces sp. A0642]|uniref:hypothetical protein n=1 Tax=Streptomyces sp. A0642 TaxID=2563100 RepID=UPI0010A22055|nr:hypothetical protein [Streptomyces sp. A0642]THA73262.1 hypothetical protein E6R60_25275 [Streptomyces sp. A0642]
MSSWISAPGHALRLAGIHFDAVRMIGIPGEQVAYEVMQFADFCAGPVIRSCVGVRSMYVLLPPGSARAPVARRGRGVGAGGGGVRGVAAMRGLTYPLDWRSLRTAQSPFVDAELLFELLREVVDDEIRDVR